MFRLGRSSSRNSPSPRIPPIRTPTRRCDATRGEETRMRCSRVMGLVLALIFCAAQAHADEFSGTLRKIKEAGSIALGFRDSSIPFSYLNDNQKPVGYAMDICYAIVE